MWCKHNWIVENETILPSPCEQLHKTGQVIKSTQGYASAYLFQKTVVVYLRCQKCNKLKIRKITTE